MGLASELRLDPFGTHEFVSSRTRRPCERRQQCRKEELIAVECAASGEGRDEEPDGETRGCPEDPEQQPRPKSDREEEAVWQKEDEEHDREREDPDRDG